MKELNRVLFAATVAVGLAAGGSAVAQSQLSGPGGTAMSPKTRFLLAEPSPQVIVMNVQPIAVWPSGVNTAAVAASPKQQQLQAQRQPGPAAPAVETASVNRPLGANGLAASPKLQQQMEENAVQFEIAPLK